MKSVKRREINNQIQNREKAILISAVPHSDVSITSQGIWAFEYGRISSRVSYPTHERACGKSFCGTQLPLVWVCERTTSSTAVMTTPQQPRPYRKGPLATMVLLNAVQRCTKMYALCSDSVREAHARRWMDGCVDMWIRMYPSQHSQGGGGSGRRCTPLCWRKHRAAQRRYVQ